MSSGIRLMNSGFPITFDGSSTPIPMEKIQLTMALTFVSMAQAQKEKRAGLVELSADKQQQIIDKFVGLTYV